MRLDAVPQFTVTMYILNGGHVCSWCYLLMM